MIKKLFRFYLLYGFRRTLFKAAGRSKLSSLGYFFIRLFTLGPKNKKIASVIGSGQFAYATIGAILTKKKIGILSCYDVNSERLEKLSRTYRAKKISITPSEFELKGKPKVVYIASNHASHTDYACLAIKKGYDVHIEKPICVDWVQFRKLFTTIKKYNQSLYTR